MRLILLRMVAGTAALAALAPLLLAQQTPAEKTAEQVFQNIQVFRGKPADELRPTMSFIASSLGVGCNFCHAQPFSADVKPTKATARKMITMVYAINRDNFSGFNEITCYTCHQGHPRPNGDLSVATSLPPGTMPPGGRGGRGAGPEGRGGRGFGAEADANGGGTPAADLPTAQQILDKYTAAMGGAEALAALHSESVTAERVAFGNPTPETVERAGGKLLLTDGDNAKSGYDGTQFWSWGSRGGRRDMTSDTEGTLRTDLALYPGAGLKAADLQVYDQETVDGATAYRLIAETQDGEDSYYFDTQTGLLLRHATRTPTYLGDLPLQVDYSDYRTVEGVQLPFDIRWSTQERSWERKVSAVKLNGAVDGAGFQAPSR